MHLIQVGTVVFNPVHVVRVDLGQRDLRNRPEVCVGLTHDNDNDLHYLADSPEGRALRWWFTEADRTSAHWSFRTLDLVAAHARATDVHQADPDTLPADELIEEFRVMPPADSGRVAS